MHQTIFFKNAKNQLRVTEERQRAQSLTRALREKKSSSATHFGERKFLGALFASLGFQHKYFVKI
jgi:hypothetical protein